MTFELSLFIGQSSLGNDGSPHFVIFQPIYKTSRSPKYNCRTGI